MQPLWDRKFIPDTGKQQLCVEKNKRETGCRELGKNWWENQKLQRSWRDGPQRIVNTAERSGLYLWLLAHSRVIWLQRSQAPTQGWGIQRGVAVETMAFRNCKHSTGFYSEGTPSTWHVTAGKDFWHRAFPIDPESAASGTLSGRGESLKYRTQNNWKPTSLQGSKSCLPQGGEERQPCERARDREGARTERDPASKLSSGQERGRPCFLWWETKPSWVVLTNWVWTCTHWVIEPFSCCSHPAKICDRMAFPVSQHEQGHILARALPQLAGKQRGLRKSGSSTQTRSLKAMWENVTSWAPNL